MKTVLTLALLAILTIESSEQYNILVVFPHFGKSHFSVFESLCAKLTAIGHNLTVVSYFPRQKVVPNYRDVDLGDGKPIGAKEILKVEDFGNSRLELHQGPDQIAYFAAISCPTGLQSKNLQSFLKEDNSFDLMLIEVFNTNCFFGFAKRFNVPMIGLSSSNILPWTNSLFGFSENPSFNPTIFMDFSSKMSFFERVENTISNVYSKWMFKYYLAAPGYALTQKYLGIDMLEGIDPLYNMSMLLINTHYSFISSRPRPPSVVEVGGIHIAPAKPLPANIEKYINDSKDGVIYMSLGSMLKGDSIPKEQRDVFLRVFSKIPQRIIWKWESTILEKPENVMIIPWAPQKDIICHPNVKVFIGHGGLGGVVEAVHCGIPVILLPHYGDQQSNSKALEYLGMGQVLHMKSITEDKLMAAVKVALSPETRNIAKTVSARFKDRPLSPMDTAIYWIEYVARHQGAHFMRPTSMELPYYQYYLLDVIAFILLILIFVIYMLLSIVKFLVSLLSGKKTPGGKQKKA